MRLNRVLWGLAFVTAIGIGVALAAVFVTHPMVGCGGAPPTAKWYPASTDWGCVEVGTEAQRTIRLKNVGHSGNLEGVIRLEPTCSRTFGIVSGSGAYSLPPMESREVVIRYAPTDTTSVEACEVLCDPES